MDKDGIFWATVWKTVAGVVIVMTIAITIYNITNNQLWYQSWNKCVEAGGQPIQDTIKGTSERAFTCVRD